MTARKPAVNVHPNVSGGGSVTIEIAGGATLTVPWSEGMNVQQALEAARDQAPQLSFGLEYYGSDYGYLVAMINSTYDTFASSDDPFFYWELFVNGTPASKGIDGTILADGDAVSFAYTEYVSAKHDESGLAVKHRSRLRR